MADRYWVNGTGTWADAANHWATTSGGAPRVDNIPSAHDDVHFDANSNTSNAAYTVTADNSVGSQFCRSILFEAKPGNGLGGTITFAGAGLVVVSGDVLLLGGMVWTQNGGFQLVATSGVKTITSNGATITSGLVINGPGATFQLADDLTVGNGINKTAGTFDPNGKTVTASGQIVTFTGAFTFFNFRWLPTTGSATCKFSTDPTITGTLTLTGTGPLGAGVAAVRSLFSSNAGGTQRTITAAAVALTDIDFLDINAAGAAAPWGGTRLGKFTQGGVNGNNCANITFDAPKNVYWVGGSGNTSDSTNHWAVASGGAPNVANRPLPQDTLVFDVNSNAVAYTVTSDWQATIKGLNFAAHPAAGVVTFAGASGLLMSGDLTLIAGMTRTYTGLFQIQPEAGNTAVITPNGIALASVFLWTGAGTQKLGGDLTTSGNQFFSAGTFDANGKTFTLSGTANINVTVVPTFANLTLNGTNTTISLSGNIVVSGTLTLSGAQSSSRLLLASTVAGTQRTVTTAVVVITDADFTDINAAGAASPWGGTRVGDRKPAGGVSNNAGITFTAGGTKFWVGGTGNTNDPTNHWATVTGGAPGVNSYPLPQDNVVFDANSNTTAYSPTINIALFVNDFSISAAPSVSGNVTLAGSGVVTMSGSLLFYAGMLKTHNGAFTFNATAAGKTITVNGLSSFGSLMTFNGVGGGWTFTDNFTVNSAVTISAGAVDTNNKTVSLSSWTANGAATKSLTLGSSTLNLTANAGYNTLLGTSYTLSAGTSVIDLQAASPTFQPGAAEVFNDVKMTSAAPAGGTKSFNSTNTFNNLTLIGGPLSIITLGSLGFTVNGTFTVTGSSGRPLLQRGQNGAAVCTVTAAAISITDADFQDVTGAGAAAPFTGTRLGNCGGNSGITFTAPSNKYWVGDAGNIGDPTVHWATVSGGAPGANNMPLPQDTAIFDAASFSANGAVTVQSSQQSRTGTLDFSAVDQTVTLNVASALTLFGSLILAATSPTTATAALTFSGRGAFSIKSSGNTFTPAMTIDAFGGALSFVDNFTTTAASIILTRGTLDLTGKQVTSPAFNLNNANTKTIKDSVGGGKMITSSTAVGTVMLAASGGTTIDRTNPWTVEVSGNTANARTFAGGGNTWPDLTFTNTTADGVLRFSGNNTFRSLNASGGTAQAFVFTAGSTTTVETPNGFPTGTVGNVFTVTSLSGLEHNLALTGGGSVTRDYVRVSLSVATPGSQWDAGSNGINNGNNVGWIFGGIAGACVETAVSTESCDATVIRAADALEVAVAADAPSALASYEVFTAEAGAAADSSDRSLAAPVFIAELLAALDRSTSWRSNVKVDTTFVGADPMPPPPPTPDPYPVRVHESHLP